MQPLSHLRAAFDSIARGHQGFASFLLYLLIGIVTFFIGLTLSFPDDAVRARLQFELERNIPAHVSIRHAEYSFPFSLSAENLLIRMNETNVPELNLDSIKLTPHLGSLIGNPGVCFDIGIGTGKINGSVAGSGEISLEVDSLLFDETIQGFQSLRLSGQIESAKIDSHLQPTTDTPSSMALIANSLKLSGTRNAGLAIDQLNFGQLDLQFAGNGRNLILQKGVLSGGDVTAEATGRIGVGKTIKATRLNLEVQVKPAAGLDTSVSSLFDLIGSPGNNGSRKVVIRGTLAYPNVR